MLLGVLAALPPLSIDISLPALPSIARALHAPGGSVGVTLGVFLAAFALGQLLLGPLSDRYGRRPVLLAGLALYAAAGVADALAPSAAVLIAARFVQGLGASAGTVVGRAIIRDRYPDAASAGRMQSVVTAINTVAPIVAPIAGAAVLAAVGWRALYGVLAAVGAALALAVARGLRESAPDAAHAEPPLREALRDYARFLRLPRTVAFTAYVALAFGAQFAFISGSPFALVTQLHASTPLYVAAFATASAGALVGSFGGAAIVGRAGAERVLAIGAAALAVAVADVLATLVLHAPSIAAYVCAMALVSLANGLAMPMSYALGMRDAGRFAGAAAACMGGVQMAGGSLGSAAVAALPLAPAAAVGAVATACGAGALAAYAAGRRSAGRRPEDASAA